MITFINEAPCVLIVCHKDNLLVLAVYQCIIIDVLLKFKINEYTCISNNYIII